MEPLVKPLVKPLVALLVGLLVESLAELLVEPVDPLYRNITSTLGESLTSVEDVAENYFFFFT